MNGIEKEWFQKDDFSKRMKKESFKSNKAENVRG
jgi:hypothetical protein